MNPRVTIGLLVVLAALGIGVYFAEQQGGAPSSGASSGPAGGPAAKEKEDPLLQMYQIDDKEIVKLEFLKGGAITTVTKDGDDWLLQPSGDLAERFRVNSLLVRVTALKANRRIGEPGDDLQVYGVASPEMIMRLWRQDDSLYELIVGGKTPNEAGTYARRPDDSAIFVIPNTLANDIEKMVSDPPKAPPTPTPFPTSTPTP
ncbi:MAG: DUF4340 domain-containing protein [Chloroflexota bacterium]